MLKEVNFSSAGSAWEKRRNFFISASYSCCRYAHYHTVINHAEEIYCYFNLFWVIVLVALKYRWGNDSSESDAEGTPWLLSHRLSCRTGEKAGADVGAVVTCHRTHSKTLDCLAMLPHLLKMLALLALNLQPLVLTHQCCVRFMEGEMMWIVRNSAPAPLLRRHRHLFLQGKPLHENMVYVETLLCFRHDFCNSFGWWDSCTVTGLLRMERDLWALLTAKQQKPESLETQREQNAGGSPELFLLGFKVKLSLL